MAEWPKRVHSSRLDAFEPKYGGGYVWVVSADLAREQNTALGEAIAAVEQGISGENIGPTVARWKVALARYEQEVGK